MQTDTGELFNLDADDADERRAMMERLSALMETPGPGKHFVPADHATPQQIKRGKVGRNEPCPCGSGKKFKKCHLNQHASSAERAEMAARLEEMSRKLEAAKDDAVEFVEDGGFWCAQRPGERTNALGRSEAEARARFARDEDVSWNAEPSGIDSTTDDPSIVGAGEGVDA